MKKAIPTYHITNLAGQNDISPEVFFTEHQINNPGLSINVPYRSNYFGIGLCVSGKAILKANLETYELNPL